MARDGGSAAADRAEYQFLLGGDVPEQGARETPAAAAISSVVTA